MRYGVISDTHLHVRHGDSLPEWIVEAFTGVDLILHAGDMVDRGMIEVLEEIAPVCAVRGNMDHSAHDLPNEREILLDGHPGWIVLAHRPACLERALRHHQREGTVIAVHGHTHLAEFQKYGDVWVLNPGSATHPRGGQNPSVAILTIDADGIPHAEFKYPPGCADE